MIPPAALPGLLLTSLVPGWLMARAVWPEERVRDPLSFLRALVLALALSIAITILVGGVLGFLPHGATGFFGPVGIAVGLVAACGGLFWWGLKRGAYPRLARRVTRSTPGEAEAPFAVARR